MKDVVIVGALRTPIGCFRGALAGHSAVELGSLVVKALIERTGVSEYAVDEVFDGCKRPVLLTLFHYVLNGLDTNHLDSCK